MRTPHPHQPTPRRRPKATFATALGQRLHELRLARGWEPRDFAARANVSLTQLAKYESGAQLPPLRTLIRMARLLGLLVDALLPDLPDLPPDPWDARLLQRLRQISVLGPEEKEATLGLLDLLVGIWRLSPSSGPAPPSLQEASPDRPRS